MKKDITKNVYFERINNVLTYIDKNICEVLSLEVLASVANFSPFHFHRIFSTIIGESLNDYISRLRLEKALFLMKYNPKIKITEVALECGFASLANFSRMFKLKYGCSATEFKNIDPVKKSKICKTTDKKTDYRAFAAGEDSARSEFTVTIQRRNSLRVGYVRVFNSYQAGNIAKAFAHLMDWAKRHNYLSRDSVIIGMSQDDPGITPRERCRYDFCISVPETAKPEGKIGITEIRENNFAVLAVRGDTQKFVKAYDYLFKDWLINSDYQPTHDPGMEIYKTSPEILGWETWDVECFLPIKPL